MTPTRTPSDPPSSGDRKKRDYGSEANALIEEMQIEVPPRPIATGNVPPGRLGQLYPVQTNAFGLMVQGESTVYVYDLHIVGFMPERNGKVKTVEFTKKGKDDCLVSDRKAKCVQVIKKLVEMHSTSFPNLFKTYYDGQSILYTLYEILAKDEREKKFPLPGDCLEGESTLTEIVVAVKATERGSFVLSPTTLVSQTANLDLSTNERHITQFLEIVVNSHALMNPNRHKTFERGKTYMTRPRDEGLTEEDIKPVGDGKTLLVGSQKSVKQIEGPRGRGTNNAAIIIDAKKAAFQVEQDLVSKAAQIIGGNGNALANTLTEAQRDRIQGVIRGLFVETLHLSNNKRIQIYGVSKQSAIESFFMKDERRISVHDFYAEQYSFNLKYPNAPVILARENGRTNCYPMEVLKVVAFQRVTIPQQTPEQSKMSTRECAVAPAVRQRLIIKCATALEMLNPENEYLKNAKLKVYTSPIKVQGRQLPCPSLTYKNDKVEQSDLGKWKTRGAQYIIPAKLEKWAVFCFLDSYASKRFTLDHMRNFAKKYTEEARKKGMNAHLPIEVAFAKEHEIEGKLGVAATHGCTFALCLVSDSLVNLHKNIKYFERKHEITTQQIQMSNVEKIMTDRAFVTLENILNKTNCKMGGLNYTIDVTQMNGLAQKWLTAERLYLGLHLSHPAPRAVFSEEIVKPSVVGYAANMKPCPHEIVGDFMLQDGSKGDFIPCIAEIIKQVISRHKTSHGGKQCEELIIYRSNIDEGGYGVILTKEIPLIRAVLKKNGFENTKLALILVSKAHNVRLMKERPDFKLKASEQNIPAGVVCDTNLAHPALKEFYLNSHTTIQGTARTPRYTVLYDEIGMFSDEMEGMTWALAHGHQIVSLTTSLPVNLYVAERYAERGGNVFASYQEKEESSSENTSGFDDAMRLLCYNVSKMFDNRVNA